MQTFKKCSKCKVEKPATLEYFSANDKLRSRLASMCRVCKNEAVKALAARQRAENPDLFFSKKRERQKRSYEKDLERSRERSRERQARQKAKDPEAYAAKKRESAARWRAENPEKAREKDRLARIRDPEKRRAVVRASAAKAKAADPEGFRERQRASVVQWKEKYPEHARAHMRAIKARRKARKAALPDTFTKAQWDYTVTWWGGCAYCGDELPASKLTLDHVIPLSSPDCPGTIAENILPACPHCNSSKKTMPMGEFLERRFGQSHAAKRLAMIILFFSTLSNRSHP